MGLSTSSGSHIVSVSGAERSRALLMARRAHIPIYFAMLQVSVVSVAAPAALGHFVLAGIGTLLLVSLWASLKSVDRSLEAFQAWSHFVYLLSFVALVYAVLGLRFTGALIIYSTAVIVLGSAYLLGSKSAIFWSIPCIALVAIDAFSPPQPIHPVPPVIVFMVRVLVLSTILAFAVSFRWSHDQQADQLQRAAWTDPLTGLPNRLALDEALSQAVGRASRFERRGAVVFADFDGMKAINDTYGHAGGDAFLIEMAERIRKLTRSIDMPARIGGDEFVILLSEFDDPKGAEIFARKLARAISVPLRIDDDLIDPSASIGVAEFVGSGQELQSIMRLADEAMYEAKRSEASCICIADPSGARQII